MPVPPLQSLGIGIWLVGEINGTAKGVEDAPILMRPPQNDELFVEPLGVPAAKVRDAADVQVHQIPGEARPDARNALKVLQRGSGLVIV